MVQLGLIRPLLGFHLTWIKMPLLLTLTWTLTTSKQTYATPYNLFFFFWVKWTSYSISVIADFYWPTIHIRFSHCKVFFQQTWVMAGRTHACMTNHNHKHTYRPKRKDAKHSAAIRWDVVITPRIPQLLPAPDPRLTCRRPHWKRPGTLSPKRVVVVCQHSVRSQSVCVISSIAAASCSNCVCSLPGATSIWSLACFGIVLTGEPSKNVVYVWLKLS